eukprot:2876546-Amphidinium_carterae.1
MATFSPNGEQVLTCSDDRTCIIWSTPLRSEAMGEMQPRTRNLRAKGMVVPRLPSEQKASTEGTQ